MALIVVNWRVDGLKSGGEFDPINLREKKRLIRR